MSRNHLDIALPPSPPLSAQQLLNLAIEHHHARRLVEAEALYRHVLALHPESADVIHLLGVVAYDAARFPEALELMQRSIRIQPQAARYYSNLALLFSATDRLRNPPRPWKPRSAGTRERAVSLQSRLHAPATAALGSGHRRLSYGAPASTGHALSWLNLGLSLASAHRPEGSHRRLSRGSATPPRRLRSRCESRRRSPRSGPSRRGHRALRTDGGCAGCPSFVASNYLAILQYWPQSRPGNSGRCTTPTMTAMPPPSAPRGRPTRIHAIRSAASASALSPRTSPSIPSGTLPSRCWKISIGANLKSSATRIARARMR